MSARTWIMRHHASLASTLGWLRPTLFSEYVLSTSFMNIKMLEQVSYDEKENFDFFVKPVMIRMFSTIAALYWHNS